MKLYCDIVTGEVNILINAREGLREQLSIEPAPTGFRVDEYAFINVTDTTADVIIKRKTNLLEEKAQQEAQVVSDKLDFIAKRDAMRFCDIKSNKQNVKWDGLPTSSGLNFNLNWTNIAGIDGWRVQIEVEQPKPDTRIDAYRIENIDGKTARLLAEKVTVVSEEQAKAIADDLAWQAQLAAQEAQRILADADFNTWSKHERFLVAVIQKLAPDLDLKKEYETIA